ncbi:class I SAM-dependent methyltransferase [Planosporangium mesophilum]|uniref:Methyltransferase type 11 n=1 Tax=Planosporangium mesophilum TaxID=689768 RepID=A0A8J3TG41_9ACTN|nr:class I SAM-dependent methyltransferase [Planosporangium mesophilum]NJC86451.1 class I SAM-dependent methyltransferase [Planosporangium mesophilum]GII25157.1 methyltransferase type 11 [Planosporangium mesophilum]
MTETPGIDSVRARSFGAAAADYDKYRPRYPDQLVDHVVAMLPGRRVLEVGAGTGIATAAFAARGMAMTCVEPDAEMAATLLAQLAGDADLHVDVATFEEWSAARPAGTAGFDGLISAQAWHWTDPKTRWADAGAAVRSGGLIALFWNEDHHADPRVTDAFTAAYERRGIEIRSVRQEPVPSTDPDKIVDRKRPEGWPEVDAEADEYFTDLRTHQYHWTHRMSVADYVARVNTTSAHLILPSEARDDLTSELIATLTAYGGEIELAMTTELVTAMRR